MVYKWLRNATWGLYPPVCLVCGGDGEPGRDLCAGCARNLYRNAHACERCAEPLPESAPIGSLCGRCQRSPPAFDACRAPYLYAPPLDGLLTGLKFNARLAHARLLATLLGDAVLGTWADPPDLLVPVPLHPTRLRERGFNQALELARPLAQALSIPLEPEVLARARPSAPQSGLQRSLRHANVRGAFAVVRAPAARRVALVDDVLTTGHTASEIAKALKRCGVERVEVWVVARTPP
jgi:ComF family protein